MRYLLAYPSQLDDNRPSLMTFYGRIFLNTEHFKVYVAELLI